MQESIQNLIFAVDSSASFGGDSPTLPNTDLVVALLTEISDARFAAGDLRAGIALERVARWLGADLYRSSYDDGYTHGYTHGHEDGYAEGYDDGCPEDD